jgi:hypothetical protein
MRVLCFILALCFAWGIPLASCARLAPAQIEIRVSDGSGVPLEFAQPLSLVGGGTYVPVPSLLPPRSYTLIYTVRGGRQK